MCIYIYMYNRLHYTQRINCTFYIYIYENFKISITSLDTNVIFFGNSCLRVVFVSFEL